MKPSDPVHDTLESLASKSIQAIALHGVPRSGTTWLGEILNSSPHSIYKFQPLFSYRFKGRVTSSSRHEDVQRFLEELGLTSDDFLDQREKRERGILPSFLKREPTHLIYKEARYHQVLPNLMEVEPSLKLIVLLRNPLAVLSSWLAAPREFRRDLWWDPAEEWRFAEKKNEGRPEEFFGFEGWKEANRIFLELHSRFPDRVCRAEYRRLVREPTSEVERIFEFCGLPLEHQTLEFLSESTSRKVDNPYSVYRGIDTEEDWRKRLDGNITRAIIEELRDSDLEFLLYEAAEG